MPRLRGDCDAPRGCAATRPPPRKRRCPDSEGIATCRSQRRISHPAPRRGDAPTQRGLRLAPTRCALTLAIHKKRRCPDSEGIATHDPPLCRRPHSGRGDAPTQRGLRRSRTMAKRRCPDSEGIATSSSPSQGSSVSRKRRCPDSEGIATSPQRMKYRAMGATKRRCPDSEGIATVLQPAVQHHGLEEAMPRLRGDCDLPWPLTTTLPGETRKRRCPDSEGIATWPPERGPSERGLEEAMPRLRGDCDLRRAAISASNRSVDGRGDAPTQRGLRPWLGLPTPARLPQGEEAMPRLRGDCDLGGGFRLGDLVAEGGKRRCPDSEGIATATGFALTSLATRKEEAMPRLRGDCDLPRARSTTRADTEEAMPRLRGDCDLGATSTATTAPFCWKRRCPDSEGIATYGKLMLPDGRTLQSREEAMPRLRGDCDAEVQGQHPESLSRGKRRCPDSEGIATSRRSSCASARPPSGRGDAPTQRGLRPRPVEPPRNRRPSQSEEAMPRLRGDCDISSGTASRTSIKRKRRCPDSEGIATCRDQRYRGGPSLGEEAMPRLRGDCDYVWTMETPSSPRRKRRCPDSEGIATDELAGGVELRLHLEETMPRLRGDCDASSHSAKMPSSSAEEAMPRLRGDCDLGRQGD